MQLLMEDCYGTVDPGGLAWYALAQRPALNLLLALYAVCCDLLWLAVIALTALVRPALLPASARPVQQSRLRANRERWLADPKRLLRENMRLHRGAGGSPVGTLVSVVALLLTLGRCTCSCGSCFYVRPNRPEGFIRGCPFCRRRACFRSISASYGST